MLWPCSTCNPNRQTQSNRHFHLSAMHKAPFAHFIENFIKSNSHKVAKLQFRNWTGIPSDRHPHCSRDDCGLCDWRIEYTSAPELFIQTFGNSIDAAKSANIFPKKN